MPTDVDDITVKLLMEKFEEYCLPKKNLVIERRKFFTRKQRPDESIDAFITELKNLSSTCEFQDVRDGLIVYKIVDGIESDNVRDTLLRKGSNLTLDKAIETCRADEVTKKQLKQMHDDKEIGKIYKKKNNGRSHTRGFKEVKHEGKPEDLKQSDRKCRF